MYLSKHIRVDEALAFKKLHLMQLKRHKPSHSLIVLCTSPNTENLFEILKGDELRKNKYKSCYVIGVSTSSEWMMNCVTFFVDQLYNQQTLTYEDLQANTERGAR